MIFVCWYISSELRSYKIFILSSKVTRKWVTSSTFLYSHPSIVIFNLPPKKNITNFTVCKFNWKRNIHRSFQLYNHRNLVWNVANIQSYFVWLFWYKMRAISCIEPSEKTDWRLLTVTGARCRLRPETPTSWLRPETPTLRTVIFSGRELWQWFYNIVQ